MVALAAKEDKFKCKLRGDCDHCTYNDCIANDKECLHYYGKEEKICEQRYGKRIEKQIRRNLRCQEKYMIRYKEW